MCLGVSLPPFCPFARFTTVSRRSTYLGYVIFFFGLGLHRLHSFMWPADVPLLNVARVSIFFFLGTAAIGATTIVPVILASNWLHTAYPGSGLAPLLARMMGLFTANFAATMWGVRVAEHAALEFVGTASKFTEATTFVTVACCLLVLGVLVFMAAFYVHAVHSMLATSPLFKMDWLGVQEFSFSASLRRGSRVCVCVCVSVCVCVQQPPFRLCVCPRFTCWCRCPCCRSFH